MHLPSFRGTGNKRSLPPSRPVNSACRVNARSAFCTLVVSDCYCQSVCSIIVSSLLLCCSCPESIRCLFCLFVSLYVFSAPVLCARLCSLYSRTICFRCPGWLWHGVMARQVPIHRRVFTRQKERQRRLFGMFCPRRTAVPVPCHESLRLSAAFAMVGQEYQWPDGSKYQGHDSEMTLSCKLGVGAAVATFACMVYKHLHSLRNCK